MPAWLLVPRCLSWGWGRSSVFVCALVTVIDVQVCELWTATHTVNMLPPPQAQRLLWAAQETTTNATSPQMGGGTRETECRLWTDSARWKNPKVKQHAPCCEFALACSIFLQISVPSAVLTHSRWAELGSCSWHVPARLNVTNTFLYLGMAKAGRLRRGLEGVG